MTCESSLADLRGQDANPKGHGPSSLAADGGRKRGALRTAVRPARSSEVPMANCFGAFRFLPVSSARQVVESRKQVSWLVNCPERSGAPTPAFPTFPKDLDVASPGGLPEGMSQWHRWSRLFTYSGGTAPAFHRLPFGEPSRAHARNRSPPATRLFNCQSQTSTAIAAGESSGVRRAEGALGESPEFIYRINIVARPMTAGGRSWVAGERWFYCCKTSHKLGSVCCSRSAL